MEHKPFFSIVIPTFNRARFIRKTIESVLAQSFQNFEIIVVDDGSTDDTEKVVKSIASNKIQYHKKQNGERAAARNFGMQKSIGRYVNFIDSDDFVYPNHLQVAAEFQTSHPEVEIFHLGFDIKNEEGVLLKTVSNIQSVNHNILSGNILSCNGVFIKREIIEENPFNEDRALSSLEDWELWIRMCSRYPFLNSNVITSTVVQHDQRSVLEKKLDIITLKAERFIYYVLNDEGNQQVFGYKLRKATASVKTYVALHLALSGAPAKMVWKYLKEGICADKSLLLSKRFFVILKLLTPL